MTSTKILHAAIALVIAVFCIFLFAGCASLQELFGINSSRSDSSSGGNAATERTPIARTPIARGVPSTNLPKNVIIVTYHQTEARNMLSAINRFRTNPINTNDPATAWWTNKNGSKKSVPNLKPLEYDYDLEPYAMTRAAELAYNGMALSHTRPNGKISISGFSGNARGENIALGQRTAQEVFVSWREDNLGYNKEGHRRNMLGEMFGAIAIGCAEKDGVKYWVQVFRDKPISTKETVADNSRQQIKIEK